MDFLPFRSSDKERKLTIQYNEPRSPKMHLLIESVSARKGIQTLIFQIYLEKQKAHLFKTMLKERERETKTLMCA